MNVEDYENVLTGTRKTIIVGVVGSRRRNSDKDLSILEQYVLSLIIKASESDSDLKFVSGGCPKGADYFIAGLCRRYGLTLKEHFPKFSGTDYYSKVQAFYARNKLIAEDCSFLLAMVAPDRTGGTENTVGYAEKLGKRVIII